MRVEVYWNLHRRCYSVRSAKTRRVIGYVAHAELHDAEFVVSEAGRQRVLRTGVKNVHAVVRGELVGFGEAGLFELPVTEVTYNPRQGPHFVGKADGTAFAGAEVVRLGSRNGRPQVIAQALRPVGRSHEVAASLSE